MGKTRQQSAYGDFQTPLELAHIATQVLAEAGLVPRSIIEPTCGKGNFLIAASASFPGAQDLRGFEVNPAYVSEARRAIDSSKAEIHCADFFAVDWQALLAELAEPILVIGNPPWVTNAELGTLGSSNLPEKTNFQGLQGFAAKTGKSNFDISEWMLIRLMELLSGRQATLAMLCKTTVARKALLHAWKTGLGVSHAETHLIDAPRHFHAAVDACFLICNFAEGKSPGQCLAFAELGASAELPAFGLRDGQLIADITAYEKWCHLRGGGPYRWRSGIKHDCSKVMELTCQGEFMVNGMGERVDVESEYLYPMLKSSELAHGRTANPTRQMLVTQRSVGQETDQIRTRAPKTWGYLHSHAEALGRRASSIYRNRPPFSMFGVGEYTFAPFKVAISGFYKHLTFAVLGPHHHKSIVLDDTSYFIPCQTEGEAEFVAALLNSKTAREFFSAFVFWDAKRPITVGILELLDVAALAEELGLKNEFAAFHPN